MLKSINHLYVQTIAITEYNRHIIKVVCRCPTGSVRITNDLQPRDRYSQRMGHRKATGTRFVEKTFDSQVASFQGRVAKLEAVYSGYNLSIAIKTDKSDGKWTWKRQGWCQGSRATSGFKWLHACNCCGVLNWSHSKPFESKKFQQARSMKKCTQKCRLSIERPGVPVTCCDAAWLYGRSPVFVLKSLALWTRHDQWNHDFSTDLSAPDSWLQTILLLVQNSDHGDITVDDRDGLSRSPELGSQVRQVAMVSEPERSKLWDLTCLLFKAQRSVDSSWDQVSQLWRIFTFQESSRFYIRFHSVFMMSFMLFFWVEMRHQT